MWSGSGQVIYLRSCGGVLWLFVFSDTKEAREPQRNALFWIHLRAEGWTPLGSWGFPAANNTSNNKQLITVLFPREHNNNNNNNTTVSLHSKMWNKLTGIELWAGELGSISTALPCSWTDVAEGVRPQEPNPVPRASLNNDLQFLQTFVKLPGGKEPLKVLSWNRVDDPPHSLPTSSGSVWIKDGIRWADRCRFCSPSSQMTKSIYIPTLRWGHESWTMKVLTGVLTPPHEASLHKNLITEYYSHYCKTLIWAVNGRLSDFFWSMYKCTQITAILLPAGGQGRLARWITSNM